MSKRIEYQNLNALTPEEYEEALLRIVAHQHSQLWPNLDVEPGWKVIIVQNASKKSTGIAFDAMFAFHHAPADGLSGMAFHRSFLEALNEPQALDLPNHCLKLPESIALPPAVEKVVDFKISWSFFLSKIWGEFGPKWLMPVSSLPWTATTCSSRSIESYRSRAVLITVPPGPF